MNIQNKKIDLNYTKPKICSWIFSALQSDMFEQHQVFISLCYYNNSNCINCIFRTFQNKNEFFELLKNIKKNS